MKTAQIVLAALLTIATLITGCANTGSGSVSSPAYDSRTVYGVIDAIEQTTEGGTSTGIGGSGIGAGTVIGGVVGGVVGHQVGSGTGQDLATVAGVVGGAVVGHQLEKRNMQQAAYRIRVRLDNGEYLTTTAESIGDLRVGDRVRIEDGRVYRY